jgi:hypothetical protein
LINNMNTMDESKLVGRFSRMISLVFHPLFMPTYGLLILLGFDGFLGLYPTVYKWFMYGIVWVFTLLGPFASIWMLKRIGYITDYQMEEKSERLLPLGMTLISYIAGIVLLYRFGAPEVILRLMGGAAISVLLVAVITFFWKISAHMTGAGSFAGFILMISLYFDANLSMLLSLVILLGGLVGWARLSLKAHDYIQLAAGFLLGWNVMVIMLQLLLY